eukprot:COSAG01_NODE_1737_length_9362_cov_165.799309_2_plen_324_part_00
MEVMVDELGVLVINPPTQSDKRLGNRGEMVVQQTKRMAQAGMLQTRLHIDMWEESVNYGWHCHNLYPLTRNVSPGGKGPACITTISHNMVDYEMVQRRIEYARPPGTLCLVHVPGYHRGILDLTNSRYGRVVRMDGDTAVFDCVYKPTNRTFASKNYEAIEAQPGISCYQLAGAAQPLAKKPNACLIGDGDHRPKQITIIKLTNLFDDEAEWGLPVIKSITAKQDGPIPVFLTCDAAGRIFEQDGDMLRPTDGFVTITPANEVNSQAVKYYKEQWTKCITDRPKWFIGCTVSGARAATKTAAMGRWRCVTTTTAPLCTDTCDT